MRIKNRFQVNNIAINTETENYDWNTECVTDDEYPEVKHAILVEDSSLIDGFNLLEMTENIDRTPLNQKEKDFFSMMGFETDELWWLNDKAKYLRNIFRLINSWTGYSPLIIRNFDSIFYYDTTIQLYEYVKKYFHYKTIITVNTPLLVNNYISRPDCIYLCQDNGSYKQLCHLTNRQLREGHNLEKMLISGEFE